MLIFPVTIEKKNKVRHNNEILLFAQELHTNYFENKLQINPKMLIRALYLQGIIRKTNQLTYIINVLCFPIKRMLFHYYYHVGCKLQFQQLKIFA